MQRKGVAWKKHFSIEKVLKHIKRGFIQVKDK